MSETRIFPSAKVGVKAAATGSNCCDDGEAAVSAWTDASNGGASEGVTWTEAPDGGSSGVVTWTETVDRASNLTDLTIFPFSSASLSPRRGGATSSFTADDA